TAFASVAPINDGAGVTAGVQAFSVTGTSGTFTLTFGGATTNSLPVNATAVQVQAALNALPTIGGVGGSVSVTQSGNIYTVTFNNDLAGTGLPQLAVAGSGGATATNTLSVPGVPQSNPLFIGTLTMDPNNSKILYAGTGETNNSSDSFYGTGIYRSTDAGQTWSLLTDSLLGNPLYGKGISKIVVSGGVVYAAVGDGGSGRNEVQTLSFQLPAGPQTFTISFTGADSTGAVVTLTTVPIVWDP